MKVLGTALPVEGADGKLAVPNVEQAMPASVIFSHPKVAESIIARFKEYFAQKDAENPTKQVTQAEADALMADLDEVFSATESRVDLEQLEKIHQALGVQSSSGLSSADFLSHFTVASKARPKRPAKDDSTIDEG